MSIHRGLALPGACLLLAGACPSQSFELRREVVADAPTSGPRISHDPPSGTASRMTHHFTDSLDVQRAVIAGDLQRLRAPARRLAERSDPFPESWRPFMTSNVRFAESALAAASLDEAARAAADLANNCGECHAAVGLGPDRLAVALPASDPAGTPSMLRHQWAADRMWDALISHSDAAWSAGADVLSAAPLRPEALPSDVVLPEVLEDLAGRVHELGARAQRSATWSERTALYGDLLATCASCHRGLLLGRLPFLAKSDMKEQ